MFARRLMVVGALAATTVASVVLADPASAAGKPCPSRNVCVYDGANFDTRFNWQSISGYNAHTDLNGALHDHVSSWRNSTLHTTFCLIDYVSGRRVTLAVLRPGQSSYYVGDTNNDRADAVEQC